jgi:hypothetical protein
MVGKEKEYEESLKMLDDMIQKMEEAKQAKQKKEWLLIEEATLVLLKVVKARLF